MRETQRLVGRGLWLCVAAVALIALQVPSIRCDEEDGRENSQCDQHQRKCMPIRPHDVFAGVFDGVQDTRIQNALFCLNRCVNPVDLRQVHGPRMLRLNWDLMEAKLAEENLGAITDFQQLKDNERMARNAAASGWTDKDSGEDGMGLFRAKRQIPHDDVCLEKEIGSSLEAAVETCQSSQSALRGFRITRIKRNAGHDKAIAMEMKELFMLKYSDRIIEHFCPQSTDVINWCLATALEGDDMPTEFATPEELKALYCDKHFECNQLSFSVFIAIPEGHVIETRQSKGCLSLSPCANGCVEERASDVIEMCVCFRKLYDTVQTSTCRGAKAAFDRVPGQCGDKFMNEIENFAIDDHERCDAAAAPMTPEEVITLLGGNH